MRKEKEGQAAVMVSRVPTCVFSAFNQKSRPNFSGPRIKVFLLSLWVCAFG